MAIAVTATPPVTPAQAAPVAAKVRRVARRLDLPAGLQVRIALGDRVRTLEVCGVPAPACTTSDGTSHLRLREWLGGDPEELPWRRRTGAALAHDLGHAADVQLLDPAARAWFAARIGRPTAPWDWPPTRTATSWIAAGRGLSVPNTERWASLFRLCVEPPAWRLEERTASGRLRGDYGESYAPRRLPALCGAMRATLALAAAAP